ncbi:MAG: DUF2061 domain-containing protein [Ignavibacteriaceae bacterium]|jgi:uncharacterized membrane protein|nr:DUF2061 domain-containing protein [Ignavibacteriaceae bacterium]
MLDVILNPSSEKTPKKRLFKFSDRADKPIKSIIKSFSWRIVGTFDTMLISYIITGKITIAISIGSVEVITKTLLYYFHERLWAHIHRIKFNILNKSDGKRFEYNRTEQTAQRKTNRRIIKNTSVTVS